MKQWTFLWLIGCALLFYSFIIFSIESDALKNYWNRKMTSKNMINKNTTVEQNPQSYLTVSFGATCHGGGMGNKLYEFVSLYGISRSLNRIPYATETNNCIKEEIEKNMTSYFPLLAKAIELKNISENLITYVDFARNKCCTYEDVRKLLGYNSDRFITIKGWYLQSFKYFDKYRFDVLKLLTFTKDDIDATDHIAKETFKGDKNHKICVHIRRGDFVVSDLHLGSNENFTRASVLYVRDKLLKAGKNTTVAFLGDDRPWAQALFPNYSWAVVPAKTERVTTDYAFFARHCQTIILTASSSTFSFWSAYLSSAENIYYNADFAKDDLFRKKITPADVFPPNWISLRLSSNKNEISEVAR